MMRSALAVAVFLSGFGWLLFAADILIFWRRLGTRSRDKELARKALVQAIGTPLLALALVVTGIFFLIQAHHGVPIVEHLTRVNSVPLICLVLVQIVVFVGVGTMNLRKPDKAFGPLKEQGYDMHMDSGRDRELIYVEGIVSLSLGILTGAAWATVVGLSLLN